MAAGYTRDEVKIGALVVAAGAVLFVFLLKVGALPKYRETYPAVTEMESVGGLPDKEAPVKYAGKEIGYVEGIDYVRGNGDEPARLRVRMRISTAIDLPEHVQASIASATMLGDPHLEIRQVIPPDERFRRREEGGVVVIAGEAPTTLPELLADGRRILADVKRFTARLDTIGDTVERIVEGARRIVDDEDFRENIHGTVASWRKAGDEVFARVGVVGDSATEALATWREAGRTTGATISRVGARADTLVWRVDDIVARRGDTIAANLETFSARIANNPSSLIWGSSRPGRGPGTSSPTSY